jgi:hypothetical protein
VVCPKCREYLIASPVAAEATSGLSQLWEEKGFRERLSAALAQATGRTELLTDGDLARLITAKEIRDHHAKK